MTTTHAESTTALRWPPEDFYWAILDASALPRSRSGRTEQLGYLFEAFLPVAIEDVHAVYRRLPGRNGAQRYVACAAPRQRLEAEVNGALTLAPAALPACIDADVDPASLNLLNREFTPLAVRVGQRRWGVFAILILVACAALLTVGLERRTQATRAEATRTRAAALAVLEDTLGPVARESVGTAFPPERRLLAELRLLEQTRSAAAPVTTGSNAAFELAALLERWPKEGHVEAQSLSITESAIALLAQVPTMSDAQRLADALDSPPGWRLPQPETRSRRGSVAVTLRFEPAPEPIDVDPSEGSQGATKP